MANVYGFPGADKDRVPTEPISEEPITKLRQDALDPLTLHSRAGSHGSAGDRTPNFVKGFRRSRCKAFPRFAAYARQHFLYFFPLPHGQGSFRPTLTVRGETSVSRLSSGRPGRLAGNS